MAAQRPRIRAGESESLCSVVEGVAWIGLRDGAGTVRGRFGRLDQPSVDYADSGEIPIGPDEVARLDGDPDLPDRGQLRFIMAGGR